MFCIRFLQFATFPSNESVHVAILLVYEHMGMSHLLREEILLWKCPRPRRLKGHVKNMGPKPIPSPGPSPDPNLAPSLGASRAQGRFFHVPKLLRGRGQCLHPNKWDMALWWLLFVILKLHAIRSTVQYIRQQYRVHTLPTYKMVIQCKDLIEYKKTWYHIQLHT